jgi:Ca2+-binding RTX toxin-like protein
VDGVSANLAAFGSGVTIDLTTATTPGGGGTLANFEYIGTLTTTAFDDVVVTGNIGRNESITTGAGADRVTVRNGYDTASLGAGADTLVVDYSSETTAVTTLNFFATGNAEGGFSGNYVSGTSTRRVDFFNVDNFVVTTGSGNDSIRTGSGSDYIDGGAGTDTMIGGAGSDIYLVDNSGDVVTENANEGTDEVRTTLATYSLASLVNIENLTGTAAADVAQTLTGNGANNVIDGGVGADAMTGGLGDDTYVVDNAGDVVTEASSEGTDNVRTSTASYTLGADVENLTGLSNDGQALTGNDQVNVITAAAGDDVIVAGAGNDQILAGAGNDELDGGTGADAMTGGAGDDTYFVDSLADVVTEASSEGTDEVRTTTSYYFLDDNVENLTGIRSNGLGQVLTGNGLANILTGSDFNDRLDGGVGADVLAGGTGDDIYVIDAQDSVTEGADAGTDTIETSLASYILGANLENLTGTSDSGQSLSGNGGDNLITGGTGDDRLDGGGGTDTLIGGGGNDLYFIDSSGDVVIEGSGGGEDEVRTSLAVYALHAEVENLTATSDGNHDFRGNNVDNVITGAGGNDFIRLQDGGDDTVSSGASDDIVYYGAALTNADSNDGGAGNRDVLVLQGNYTLTLDAAAMTGFEFLSLQSGAMATFGDTSNAFYDYDLTLIDANVAAGVQLVVNGQSLRDGEDLTFNGSAELDGRFLVYGGHGVDTLTGGANNDIFFFEGQRWGASDSVNGGGGRDALVIAGVNGLNLIEFGETSLTSIESISVNNRFATDPSAVPSYELVLANGNVTAGGALIVNGSSLGENQTLEVDGSAVRDGSLTIYGGAGVDLLIGGAGGDHVEGGLNGDTLYGGAGADLFVYRSVLESDRNAQDGIQDFALGDRIDLSRIDAVAGTPVNEAFTFVGSGEFSGAAGELRAVLVGGTLWSVLGDVDGDKVADFQVSVVVTDTLTHPLTGADFVL